MSKQKRCKRAKPAPKQSSSDLVASTETIDDDVVASGTLPEFTLSDIHDQPHFVNGREYTTKPGEHLDIVNGFVRITGPSTCSLFLYFE